MHEAISRSTRLIGDLISRWKATDAAFQSWVEGVAKPRIQMAAGAAFFVASVVYLVKAPGDGGLLMPKWMFLNPYSLPIAWMLALLLDAHSEVVWLVMSLGLGIYFLTAASRFMSANQRLRLLRRLGGQAKARIIALGLLLSLGCVVYVPWLARYRPEGPGRVFEETTGYSFVWNTPPSGYVQRVVNGQEKTVRAELLLRFGRIHYSWALIGAACSAFVLLADRRHRRLASLPESDGEPGR